VVPREVEHDGHPAARARAAALRARALLVREEDGLEQLGRQLDVWRLERRRLQIGVTAHEERKVRIDALTAGAIDFIAKPINEDALHDALARVITTLRARGATLSPPRSAPSVADLDALFGLQADAQPVATPHIAPNTAAASAAPPLQERLRQAYARDLPQRLAALAHALQARDAEAASMGLHGLKGSTGFMAPEGTAHALCSSLEHVTLLGDWARADADWPALQAALLALAEPS
jgi:hypothetical protein